MGKKFGTALNCIDGRTQIPIINWLKENYNVDYVDLITEPGMDKVLSQGKRAEINRLKKSTIISISAHDSKIVAVVGHYDCAANPVSSSKQIREIAKSTCVVKSWGLPVSVVGLWVDKNLCVHVVCK